MIEITSEPIRPEMIIDQVKTDNSGCIVSYIGLIRETSYGKEVVSVEYEDASGHAEGRLSKIADKALHIHQFRFKMNINIFMSRYRAD